LTNLWCQQMESTQQKNMKNPNITLMIALDRTPSTSRTTSPRHGAHISANVAVLISGHSIPENTSKHFLCSSEVIKALIAVSNSLGATWGRTNLDLRRLAPSAGRVQKSTFLHPRKVPPSGRVKCPLFVRPERLYLFGWLFITHFSPPLSRRTTEQRRT
jgi:hypothetical protein